jgi:hypothetical protein
MILSALLWNLVLVGCVMICQLFSLVIEFSDFQSTLELLDSWSMTSSAFPVILSNVTFIFGEMGVQLGKESLLLGRENAKKNGLSLVLIR